MRVALGRLSHVDAKAYDLDAVDLFRSDEKFAEVVPADAALIVETTASLQVLIAASVSAGLTASPVRLARAVLFGQGRCAVLILEAEGRKARVDDITAFLFELCRRFPDLRAGMAGTSSDSWNVFEAGETIVLDIPDDGGWQIRVLAHVAHAIDEDAHHWGRLETGGALVGRVSYEARTITIAYGGGTTR